MNAQIKITYRDKNGNIIENPENGMRAYSPETKKLYIYNNGIWDMIKDDINLGMNVYDLNKQIISQLSFTELQQIFNILNHYVRENKYSYYMLLCRDINYYTIFKLNREIENSDILNTFSEDVIDCVQNIGTLKSADVTEDGAIEIWVHPEDSEPMVMYLFPYDTGVIECTL